jgi:hypothetical protein
MKNLVGDTSTEAEEEPKKLVESASVKHIKHTLGKDSNDMSMESVFEAAIGNTLADAQDLSSV